MTSFRHQFKRPAPGLCVLHIEGELSLGLRMFIRETLENLEAQPELRLAIDLTNVRLISSAAIGEMARLISRLIASERSFAVICPAGDVREILTVADFHELVPFYDTISHLLQGESP